MFTPENAESNPEFIQKVKEIGYQTPPQGAAGVALAMRERPDRRDVISASVLPILLVAGEKDKLIPAEKTFTVDKPNVTQAVIAGAGHMSMFEAPEELAKVMKAYLENISSAADKK